MINTHEIRYALETDAADIAELRNTLKLLKLTQASVIN